MMLPARFEELKNRRAGVLLEVQGLVRALGSQRRSAEWIEMFDEIVRLRRLLLEVTGAQKPRMLKDEDFEEVSDG